MCPAHSSSPRLKKVLLSFLTLLLLAALFVLIEAGLRRLDIGAPATFFLPQEVDGSRIYRDNPAATIPYFGPQLARAPAPVSFPAEKSAGTFRIFVLGGSAAAGDPEPAFRFSRLLQAALQGENAEHSVEVINIAITAVNSHVLRRTMKEVARHEPDLVILYLGHNEVVGPFGPASLFGRFTPRLADIALRISVRSSRLGQLWGRTLARLGLRDGAPAVWEGMGMFLDRQIAHDDPRLESVHRHFHANLRAMLREAEAASAHVILCTVAAELRHCPPFASQVPPSLSADDALLLQALLSETSEESLQNALQLAPHHAEIHYRLARRREFTHPDEAAIGFALARDYDALRFRADARINHVIREVAQRAPAGQVTLLDIEAAAAQRPAAVWPDLFLDHVHFTHRGNLWMAERLFEEITTRWPDRFAGARFEVDAIERAVAWSDWAAWRIAIEMSRRHAKPPFTFQWNHADRARQWTDQVMGAAQQVDLEANEIERRFEHAIANAPHDWFLHHAFGEFLIDRGQYHQAVTPLQQAHALTRHRGESRDRLALAHAGAGQMEEVKTLLAASTEPEQAANLLGHIGVELGGRGATAEAVLALREACTVDPRNAALRAALGGALLMAGLDEEAQETLVEALRLNPRLADAHNNLGSSLARQGKLHEAAKHFRDALEADPTFPPARRNYLHALQRIALADVDQGQDESALGRLREALELDPFFLPAMLDLALLHATSRVPGVFSASEAMLWAGRALQVDASPTPNAWVAMAAALAADARPEEAEQAAREAIALVPPANRAGWEGQIQALLREIQPRIAAQAPHSEGPQADHRPWPAEGQEP